MKAIKINKDSPIYKIKKDLMVEKIYEEFIRAVSENSNIEYEYAFNRHLNRAAISSITIHGESIGRVIEALADFFMEELTE